MLTIVILVMSPVWGCGSCNSCSEAESQLDCYPNRKTVVKNELPLFKRTNQERPYEQPLHYGK